MWLASGAGGVRYWLGRPENVASHDYELIAAPLDVELVPGHKTPAWAYGGQVPGLELRCRQGERLRVRFINRLDVPTTIHWHGIRLPIEMDGVPYVSQAPVLPGEFFDYNFICPDAGSYWYHPHTASAEQLGRGLVGPLIVEEAEASGFAHERTLCLKTWAVDGEGGFTPFSVPREAARGGTPGRLSSINGQHNPRIALPAGQIVRLRLLNLDSTITYRLNLPGAEVRIYALDGNPIPPRPLGKEYWLGPGMRIDLALRVPAAGHELPVRNGPLRLATLVGEASSSTGTDWPAALPANPIAEPDLVSAQTLRFNFEWAAMLSENIEQGARLQTLADQWAGLGHSGQGLCRQAHRYAEAGRALHLRVAQPDPVPASDPPAWYDLQGAGLRPALDRAVLHRHLPAGQERDGAHRFCRR